MKTRLTQFWQPVRRRSALRTTLLTALFAMAWVVSGTRAYSQTEPAKQFNEFVKRHAATLRADDKPPANAQEWAKTREMVRSSLLQAWGGFPKDPCPLEPRSLGELKCDGYRIEKIVFQTLPAVWMTANVYVPDGAVAGKTPAVLCVHGHWPGAKQDPVVQSRCIGLVRLGFFVLCVDAFGAGERAIETKLGEYHGEMTGAMLLPIGKPLSGIQVYENMRAVDYLQSRPEVDPARIGITGASGGGNQSLYAGGFDERFRCVVPTCSVGTYQSYLTTACCMCEVVPGILRTTEEGNVLALAADRGLMVTSATQDAFQFSVDQARISVARAREVAGLRSAAGPDSIKHTIIESPHHYNQPMREAMYGWMTKHLKGETDGSPIPEPKLVTEEPEALRCYPGTSRPADYVTLPRFAFAEAKRLKEQRRGGSSRARLAALSAAKTAAERTPLLTADRTALAAVLNVAPTTKGTREARAMTEGNRLQLSFEVEPGLEIVVLCDPLKQGVAAGAQKLALLLDIDQGADATFRGDLAAEYRRQGYAIVAPELRATGRYTWPTDKIFHAPDHNSAEWSLLIGRPLLGQWVDDVRQTVDAVMGYLGATPADTLLVAQGSSAVIGLTAGALDPRISAVTTRGGLASYASDRPCRGQRLGIMVPGLLRDVGDVDEIAALIAPRPLTIRGAVNAPGEPLPLAALTESLRYCGEVYSKFDARARLMISAE